MCSAVSIADRLFDQIHRHQRRTGRQLERIEVSESEYLELESELMQGPTNAVFPRRGFDHGIELMTSWGPTKIEKRKDYDLRGYIDESIRRHNQSVEAFIRSYLRENRTTRLDIELVVDELRLASCDEQLFLLRPDRDVVEIRMHRNVGIRQKLPRSFRPPLPD